MNLSGIMNIGNSTGGSQAAQGTSNPLYVELRQMQISKYILAAQQGKEAGPEMTNDIESSVDDFMMSEEAMEEMNEISGTDGQDIIKAWVDEESKSVIVSINGEEKSYTAEEALKGFNISSGDGDDIIDFSGVQFDALINAGNGNNNITLAEGRNIVRTGNGDNTITGTAQRANIKTGSGKDNIDIDAATSSIDTGNGNDNVKTGQGINVIDTGKGNDNVSVGDGNNIIDTGKGNDNVTAGNGNNTIETGNGNDSVKAGNGNNVIDSGNGNDNIITGDGNNKIYAGKGKDSVSAGNGNNYIEGGKGNDAIVAGDGNNVIYGLDGKDTITAGKGNNYIDGGKGNDRITAYGGDNIIFGGLGKDTLYSSGENTKIFDDGDGSGIHAADASVNLYDSSKTSSLGKSVKIEGDSDFKMRAASDLEAYRATESGRELLKQLDNSGHKTTITELDRNVNNGYASADPDKKFINEDGSRGKGTDATISYNPSFSLSHNGSTAPPSAVLFHEGVHAYNDTTGTMQPGKMLREDGTIVNRCEQQAVGLNIEGGIEITHPDGTTSASNPELLTENAFRREIGIPERTRY